MNPIRHLMILARIAVAAMHDTRRTARSSHLWRKARRMTYVPLSRPTWNHTWSVDSFARESRVIGDARRVTREAHASHLRASAAMRGTVRAWDAPASAPKPRRGHERLTWDSRRLIRYMRDTVAREYVAASLAREAGIVNRDRVKWNAANGNRAQRARAKYLASLTPDQRTMLDALRAMPIESVDTIAESHARGYDSEPARGITSAREARVNERGAGKASYKRMSGHAARVTLRDTIAPTSTDEWGLAATAIGPMETVGYASHPLVTREQHAYLLDAVRTDPSRATVRVLHAGPHGRMMSTLDNGRIVSDVRPVSSYTNERDARRDAAREARRDRVQAALARVKHATRHTISDDRDARNVALLASVATYGAADTE